MRIRHAPLCACPRIEFHEMLDYEIISSLQPSLVDYVFDEDPDHALLSLVDMVGSPMSVSRVNSCGCFCFQKGKSPRHADCRSENATCCVSGTKAGLEEIECFCKGTELKRMMKCGAQCACASDATKRHGPYFELTYKANSKTVNVKLSPKRLRSTEPQNSNTAN
jgi:hypothetical protein